MQRLDIAELASAALLARFMAAEPFGLNLAATLSEDR
jgi:hypothetical protein